MVLKTDGYVCEYLQASMRVSWSQAENRADGGKDPGDKRQYLQWQNNLLDHIDAVQDEVSHRMDFIERELDGKKKVCHSCMFLCVNKLSPLVFVVLFSAGELARLYWRVGAS